MSLMSASGQTDSVRCFHVSDARRLLAGYEQSVICDSLNTANDSIIKHRDEQLAKAAEIHEGDSIRIHNLGEVVDIADKETRKQKGLKYLFGGSGILIILVLLL